MAFAGMMVVAVIMVILCTLLVLGMIALIIGIVLRGKKHKQASKVLFITSGVMIGIVAIVVILAVMPKSKKIPTPSGEAVIKPSWIEAYEKCLETHNMDELRNLVDQHPDIVYYYDQNHVMLLDYGLYNCDIDIMQIALDHGAVFDEPLRYDHMVFYSSFDSFFSELDYPTWEKSPEALTVKGETTDKMIDAIEFAIDNGAKLKWEVNHDAQADNFFEIAGAWVHADGVISEKDIELLQLIADSDPEMKELYDSWESGE